MSWGVAFQFFNSTQVARRSPDEGFLGCVVFKYKRQNTPEEDSIGCGQQKKTPI